MLEDGGYESVAHLHYSSNNHRRLLHSTWVVKAIFSIFINVPAERPRRILRYMPGVDDKGLLLNDRPRRPVTPTQLSEILNKKVKRDTCPEPLFSL